VFALISAYWLKEGFLNDAIPFWSGGIGFFHIEFAFLIGQNQASPLA
jgi:hypothetical protein